MYWGDQNIWVAKSDDLINGAPVVDSTAKPDEMTSRSIAKKAPELKVVFGRGEKFDSDLVEPGLTESGILLLYNSDRSPMRA